MSFFSGLLPRQTFSDEQSRLTKNSSTSDDAYGGALQEADVDVPQLVDEIPHRREAAHPSGIDESEIETATRHVEDEASLDNETETFGTSEETVDEAVLVVRKDRSLAEATSEPDGAIAAEDGDAFIPAESSEVMLSSSGGIAAASPLSPPSMFSSAATAANARLRRDEVTAPPLVDVGGSFSSHVEDVNLIHSAFILVFIVVAILVIAIRRSRDQKVSRGAAWLFPIGSTGALLHTQRDVRDFLRSLQPNQVLRNVSSASSRVRATLRNMARRQSLFSATAGRWRMFPVQYCPLRWAESPEEGSIADDADESASLQHLHSALDGTSSNIKIRRVGSGVAETLENGSVRGWTQDWDISPRQLTDDGNQGSFKDGSDIANISTGGSSLGPVKESDDGVVADAVELGIAQPQGEEDLMNFFLTGSRNRKKQENFSRSQSRGGGADSRRKHSRHVFEKGDSRDGDAEQDARPGPQAEGVAEADCASRDHLFPGNHSLHFQPILTNGVDVQWVVSLAPEARHNERWTLLYSTANDGISLNTLFRANQSAGGSGPALMLIRDDKGGVFGAYTSDRWRREKIGRCYGNGEAFVFSVAPQRVRYSWTQANYLFQSGSSASLSLGGGSHFAIWLDGDLHNGTSGTCETFGSPCLSSAPEFRIEQLEVWGFTALNRRSSG